MTYITPHRNETLPELWFAIGREAIISEDIENYIVSKVISKTETEEVQSNGCYKQREGEFEMPLDYANVSVNVYGKLHERWQYSTGSYDVPTDWILNSQYIEIKELECTDEKGDYVLTNFDKEEFNSRQRTEGRLR